MKQENKQPQDGSAKDQNRQPMNNRDWEIIERETGQLEPVER